LSSCAAGLPREIEPSKKFRDRALNPGSTRRPPVSVHTVLIYEDGRGDEGGIIRAIVTGLRTVFCSVAWILVLRLSHFRSIFPVPLSLFREYRGEEELGG